jgi:hypothetical protein
MAQEKIKTKTFELIEETQIKKEGKQTFWYTTEQDPNNQFSTGMMVTDSLSFTKEEAERMYNLIVEHNGVMNEKKVLKSLEVVAK